MSLIIASAKQEYSDDIGVEDVASFTNYFSNPIVIPPHSEIAVSTVNVSRLTGQGKGSSAFVRLNNFPTMSSFNGATHQRTQIVCEFPRETDTGGHSGPLHYEPPFPLYLDIGNIDEIHLSQISIDIVDVNGVLVTDLDNGVGSKTVVILHVRQKDHAMVK